MPEKPTIVRGDVWVDAKGQRRYVTCILRNTDGTETVEFREGDFKPAKRMTAQKFAAQCQKETANDEKQAERLAAIFGGEAWDSGGGIWLAAYWRGDDKYIVFSGDAVCEYEDEEAFDEGRATNTIVLASGDEEWWVIRDEKGNTYYQNDEYEVGWRDQEEAERQARYLQTREGGTYFVKEQ